MQNHLQTDTHKPKTAAFKIHSTVPPSEFVTVVKMGHLKALKRKPYSKYEKDQPNVSGIESLTMFFLLGRQNLRILFAVSQRRLYIKLVEDYGIVEDLKKTF
ncbi:hypothetical protein CDAR_95571 [Caerostris darwini]|uniref:Uncharacterized protein n=1 Tax=Caerostris darwini TaxID=1538125 RepID=A0AAV4M781_9ARAC|nr:hypothetical protein CDAR_95571 [Caerostris darwini]